MQAKQDIHAIGAKVDALWKLPHKPGGQRWMELAREILGTTNPVGDGDAKTASPSTYRPVGSTCPQSCPYLGSGCYAEGGNVNLHQVRAQPEPEPGINAAILAMVWAAKTGRKARLHVSGDFCGPDGEIDWAYVCGIGEAAREVRARAWTPVVAWSYTHASWPVSAGLIKALGASGVVVRASDQRGPMGAIVRDFADVASLQVRTLKCPAQLPQSLTCNECRACWERPDHTIVFKPHGASKNRAREAALRVL